jgi:hypothetical protein
MHCLHLQGDWICDGGCWSGEAERPRSLRKRHTLFMSLTGWGPKKGTFRNYELQLTGNNCYPVFPPSYIDTISSRRFPAPTFIKPEILNSMIRTCLTPNIRQIGKQMSTMWTEFTLRPYVKHACLSQHRSPRGWHSQGSCVEISHPDCHRYTYGNVQMETADWNSSAPLNKVCPSISQSSRDSCLIDNFLWRAPMPNVTKIRQTSQLLRHRQTTDGSTCSPQKAFICTS